MVVDFRTSSFDIAKVEASGRDVGRKVYWQLYVIENLVRIIIHSVLTAQLHANWWSVAVNQGIQSTAQKFKNQYAKRPWHSAPGSHDIYYVFLSDLNEIIRANKHLFQTVIPDIDQWIVEIERVRFPRNIVGHMNWPTPTDRQRISMLCADIKVLTNQISGSGMNLLIP